MWNLNYLDTQISVINESIDNLNEYIKKADFDTDVTSPVLSRQQLIKKLTNLEEIKEQMVSTLECGDMNDYISNKAQTYRMIERYNERFNTAKTV